MLSIMATGLEDERGDELWFELPGGDGGDLGVLRLSGPPLLLRPIPCPYPYPYPCPLSLALSVPGPAWWRMRGRGGTGSLGLGVGEGPRVNGAPPSRPIVRPVPPLPVPPLPSQIDRGLAGRVGKGAEATAPRRLDPLLFFDRPRLPDHFPAPRAVLLEKSGPSSTLRPELRSNGDLLGGSGRKTRRRHPVPPLPFSSSPALDSRPRFPSPQPLESEPQCP